MTATDYDTWLYSNLGNEPDYCPHCETYIDDCDCDEDDLQQVLTELDAQIKTSKVWMRGYNQKNGMR